MPTSPMTVAVERHAPTAPRRGRAARATIISALSLAMAIGAHAAAGGGTPGLGMIVVAAVAVGMVAVVLTTRRVRWQILWAALAAEQIALHLAFAASDRCLALVAGAHVHAASPVMDPSCMVTMHHPTGAAAVAMWATHAAATGCTAWLTGAADRWVGRVVDQVLVAARRAPSLIVVAAAPTTRTPTRGRMLDGVRDVVAARGPPRARYRPATLAAGVT